MGVNPLDLERAPVSRILRWLHFWDEQLMYETFRAEEARFQAESRIH